MHCVASVFLFLRHESRRSALKCKNQKTLNDHGSSRQKIGHNGLVTLSVGLPFSDFSRNHR